MARYKWKGIKRTQQLLKTVSSEARQKVDVEVQRSATELHTMQRRLAPVKFGEYKSTINVTKHGDGYKVGPDPDQLKAKTSSPNLPKWLEFGTAKAPAKPHLFNSARAVKPSHNRRVGRAVREAVGLAKKRKKKV